jgi:hypothetical protein
MINVQAPPSGLSRLLGPAMLAGGISTGGMTGLGMGAMGLGQMTGNKDMQSVGRLMGSEGKSLYDEWVKRQLAGRPFGIDTDNLGGSNEPGMNPTGGISYTGI